MNITINTLERDSKDDTVVTAHWNASVVDGDFTASSYGSASFSRDEDSATFVPFAKLTEAMVVGWLELDEDLEANLLAQIVEKKAPKVLKGTPWVKV